MIRCNLILFISIISITFLALPCIAVEPPAKERPTMIPTDQAIKQMQARVAKNPKDFFSLNLLGQLYLRQAKEQDTFADYQKAEQAFSTALKFRPTDRATKNHLATAYLAQHRFKDAFKLTEEIVKATPNFAPAWATYGDAALELGRYPEAEKAIDELVKREPSPAVWVRQAHLLELQGKTDEAITILKKAAKREYELSRGDSALAWYEWRLGTALFNIGKIDAAQKQFQTALKLNPQDIHAAMGLAQTQVAEDKLDAAMQTLTEAKGVRAEPPLLAMLGDLATKMNKLEEAKTYYTAAEAGMLEETKNPASAKAHSRERVRFYLDRGIHLEEALELAKAELEQRADSLTYDTLAWAYYKNGQYAEAKEACEQAMKLNSKDAGILYHCGAIHYVLGENEKTLKMLQQAMKINPHFSILDSDHAKAVIKAIRN